MPIVNIIVNIVIIRNCFIVYGRFLRSLLNTEGGHDLSNIQQIAAVINMTINTIRMAI